MDARDWVRTWTDALGVTREPAAPRWTTILAGIVGAAAAFVANRLGLTFRQTVLTAVAVGVVAALVFPLLTRRAD